MRAGRKRKMDRKRTKSGRISRAGRMVSAYDHGTARAQEARRLYGTNCADPAGRAYAAGLLGEGRVAKDRLDKARKFSRAYSRIYGRSYCCALDDTPRGRSTYSNTEAERALESWLDQACGAIDEIDAGLYVRQLTNADYADGGPDWLDKLLPTALANKARALSHKEPLVYDQAYERVLQVAIKGLDAIRP